VRAASAIAVRNRSTAATLAERAQEQARQLAGLEHAAQELREVAQRLGEVARRFASA
jgi:hypothetical protein